MAAPAGLPKVPHSKWPGSAPEGLGNSSMLFFAALQAACPGLTQELEKQIDLEEHADDWEELAVVLWSEDVVLKTRKRRVAYSV